ncbi:MAG: histidine phosphatase family protein [Trueperaceae bacterium]|nr:histidine phosphatase family protein [Truepera sp.]HRQ09907.1 histidine phosphatase family protein [Trueperaceae bacterium]
MKVETQILELWLIRQGKTDWNRDGRVQGHGESALSDLGKR